MRPLFRIDEDALNKVYAVSISGERYLVTGTRSYCYRRAAEARAKGKTVSTVGRLVDVV